MVAYNILEQVSVIDFVGCGTCYEQDGVEKKTRHMRDIYQLNLRNKTMKCYKIMAIPVLTYARKAEHTNG